MSGNSCVLWGKGKSNTEAVYFDQVDPEDKKLAIKDKQRKKMLLVFLKIIKASCFSPVLLLILHCNYKHALLLFTANFFKVMIFMI